MKGERWRQYRMLKGCYGLGIHRSPSGHWSIELGPRVFTNEPGPSGFDEEMWRSCDSRE